MSGSGADHHSPKQILAQRSLRPRRRFGQNFLVDERFATRIANAIPDAAYAIEIGGGTGTLTGALAERCRFLKVLEVDRDLVAVMRERFAGADNVSVHDGDALEFDYRADLQSQPSPRAICGNLPYYITTPLLERIVASSDVWEAAVIMVQREYAQRLSAVPGTANYGSLALFTAHHCAVEKLFDIGAAGMYPAPTVASAVVRLRPRPDRLAKLRNEALLLWLIRAAFAQRRKMLVNSVASQVPHTRPVARAALQEILARLKINADTRAERLSLDDYIQIANALDEAGFVVPPR
ncbi:MAG: 16S rRNA (adenine(1518)-N(6)/adenine(1519)-N(6))-dimethyltransferase RsmA [Candidatus Eremiobacteraeota bacterium]|nr:16S rRNA (adenine(1518)-N(6)/adenine(1519)-N(6))-dimethyltransferase RsmA [Candidatus Eremiobacteraeota bacterium]